MESEMVDNSIGKELIGKKVTVNLRWDTDYEAKYKVEKIVKGTCLETGSDFIKINTMGSQMVYLPLTNIRTIHTLG